jgi:hypothetical protein
LKFDVSSIPSNAVIRSAIIRLFVNSGGSASNGNLLTVRKVTSTWTESTNYGAGLPSRQTAPILTTSSTDFYCNSGAKNIGIPIDPAVVSAWVSGPSTNYGVAIEYKVIDSYSANSYIGFVSREGSTSSQRPYLEVNYYIPKTQVGTVKVQGPAGAVLLPIYDPSTVTSGLRISDGGVVAVFELVPTTDPNASSIRIQTSSGVKSVSK